MDLYEKIFNYCERAGDVALTAEPLNAITNVAFLVAASLGALALRRQPFAERRPAEAALIGLVGIIGIGSFLFHVYATRWASYADSGSIAVFMLAYLGFALRRFLAADWLTTGLALGVFFWSLRLTEGMACDTAQLLPVTAEHSSHCLNGTLGYLPALLTLFGLGAVLATKRHPIWPYFLGSGAILALSMTFRTLDWEICDAVVLGGRARGTHFLWHLLNATLLYVLLKGAILHGRSPHEARVHA